MTDQWASFIAAHAEDTSPPHTPVTMIKIQIHVSGYISLIWFNKHWKTGAHCPTLELLPMLNIWLGLELS